MSLQGRFHHVLSIQKNKFLSLDHLFLNHMNQKYLSGSPEEKKEKGRL